MDAMLSTEGKKLLIVKQCTFRKDKDTALGVPYRCSKRGCPASLLVDKSEEILLKTNEEHKHEPPEKLDVKKIQNGLKRKAMEDLSERPNKLINRALYGGCSDKVTTTDIENIIKTIYRTRRSVLPPLPQSMQDVHEALQSINCFTNMGENFLLINNVQANIIIFSCGTNLKHLCTCENIYVDGTFDYCAKFFYQLFTIHSLKNGHYTPVVFMLLPNKESATYSLAFKLLIEYCQGIELVFRPIEITCDFEQSIHVGIRSVWPASKIIGCRFHLTQAWFRKLENVGLVCEYKDMTSEIGCWLRWTFGLLFLNCEEVDCFVEDLYSVIPQDSRVIKYADYLVDNYIQGNATFPPHLWASLAATVEKTTNCCEAFHSHFNSYFYKSHPDIFKFISALQDIQANSYVKINSVNIQKKIY